MPSCLGTIRHRSDIIERRQDSRSVVIGYAVPEFSASELYAREGLIHAIKLPALGSCAELSLRSIHALTTSGNASSENMRVPPQRMSLDSGLIIKLKLVTMPK
jgi:hypothetical protein